LERIGSIHHSNHKKEIPFSFEKLMKKTLSINISGILFHIEEDGYDTLKNYLESINTHFSGYSDSKEIISDIENRIAEIFLSYLKNNNQVITAENVTRLIEKMGTIADFSALEEKQEAGEEEARARGDCPQVAAGVQQLDAPLELLESLLEWQVAMLQAVHDRLEFAERLLEVRSLALPAGQIDLQWPASLAQRSQRGQRCPSRNTGLPASRSDRWPASVDSMHDRL
jgi:hypothetical protein